ncbi:MAG: HAMP domain-containing histidine kinase [Proteobacteria bacterium]|nr:HAMP domain-containing histidine kinase [Pseudomonadota bacterium]MBU1736922.1 HAMP domain-containing histidine kinase [Pseudomonadota bacterium]
MSKIKKLQSLKEKMIALQSGNYDVEEENPQIVKCWERLGCEKKDCPAYGRLRCWSIAGTSCHGAVQGEFAQKLGDCRKCVVYKESCGDEISEFVEVFNQMVKDLKFNLSEQEKNDRQQAKDARTAELGNMIAAVAHETRNPLHSIGIAASYLKKNFHGELVTEFLNVIEEEVKKLNTLTSIFLSFSNPAPLALEPCDINSVTRTAVDEFSNSVDNLKKPVLLRLAEHLPLTPCDTARMREALTKLLENSVESSAANTEILVGTSTDGKTVRISVTDHGPGISQEEQKNIFKPFYTTKTNGPGLGLPIVERTAREHNGSVSVDSQPGQGSTFTISLPIGPAIHNQPAGGTSS